MADISLNLRLRYRGANVWVGRGGRSKSRAGGLLYTTMEQVAVSWYRYNSNANLARWFHEYSTPVKLRYFGQASETRYFALKNQSETSLSAEINSGEKKNFLQFN